MNYINFKKEFHLFLFATILFNKIFITTEGNCILKKFKKEEIQRMKCKTVSTGYNICVETKGIYSFNSLLTKTLYYHDFSSITTIGDSFLLGKVVIEELKISDKKNNIILCFLSPSYLFVLSYRGEFIFFNQFENPFQVNNYCGIFLYNYINSTKDYNYIIIYTQGFRVNIYQYSINLDKESNEFKNTVYYEAANDAGTSCELLIDNMQRNILVCFMVVYSEGKKFSVVSFLTDQNLEHLSTNIFTLDQELVDNVKLIRTSSYDKKKVLVSLIEEGKAKLAIYNIIDNSLSQFIPSIEGCISYYYSINLYYFDNSEEFVFSCINSQPKYLRIIPITKNFTIKENNKFEKYDLEGDSNIEMLSILFIKPLNIYNAIVINSYDYKYLSYNYLLIEDDSNCDNTIQNIQQLNETYNEESIDDEQYPPILETSQREATSQITEKLTSQKEITIPNTNTEYIQINNPTQTILTNTITPQTQSIETNEVKESIEISQTNNVIDLSKTEQTNYAMKSNEINESNQIIETSQILVSDKSNEDSSQIEESQTNKSTENIESNQVEESQSIKLTEIIKSNQVEESQTFKPTEITESSQVEDSQSFKPTETFGSSQVEDSQSIKYTESEIIVSSQVEDSQSIKSNEIEIIESSQTDILNNFSNYSEIPENNQTNEILELPETIRIIFSTEITESSNIYNTEEITNKLTYVNDSDKIDELTQKIFSNKITESEILTESSIVTDNSKTELSKIKETDIINKVTENIKTEGVNDDLFCEEKCSKCNEDSKLKSLCIECNEEKKYFKIIFNNNIDDGLLNGDYKECIKEESKPKNYYFNETERAFKPCYYTCETCSKNGDSNDHNCNTCAKNYILNINKNNNCIIGCKYYFYFTNYKEYKCTIDNQCPEEASILIPELTKCTNNCMDEENYQYQYNGQCLNKCPGDTEPNENNICQIKSVEKCTYKLLDLFLDNEIEKSNIEKLAKNYAKEFSYTNNHIINYMSDEYSIILYKTSECITKLRINIPKIDFKECYQKVKDHYSLQKDLVIAIIDRYIYNEDTGVKNPDTTYAFFHPETGENLNATEICKEVKIIVEENILSIIEDNKTVLFFSNQNVDIFNISNEFYTDICFHFESPNKRDVVIRDRIQTYYPNITLCDSGCKNKGINLTSLTAICECSFKDLLDNNFLNDNGLLDNLILNGLIEEFAKALKILNLEVMKCYMTIFNPEYMSKCTGFYIVLIILLFELTCIITYFFCGKKEFIGFIFKISQIYKNLKLLKIKQKVDLDFNKSLIKAPPKKNKSISKKSAFYNIKNIPNNSNNLRLTKKFEKSNQSSKSISLNKLRFRNKKKKSKSMKNVNISINMAKVNINNIPQNNNNNSNSIALMNSNYMNKSKEIGNMLNNNSLRKKKKSKTGRLSVPYKAAEKILRKYDEKSKKKKFNIQNYLMTPFDDMDFEDAILERKRNFIIYFFERIKTQHIFINSFFIVDNIQPKSIKILLFLTEVDLYLLINAMLFNEDYISEIFHIEKKESFFSFVPRSINRYIYTTFSGTIIKFLIKLFFIKEKKYIKLLKRSESPGQLNSEIYFFYQKLSKGYNYFIIITICIALFSWYYISCFINIYQYTKNEWIISSIFFIIVTLAFNALSTLLEAIFRYLSFKCENDQIYKFSLYFRMFE